MVFTNIDIKSSNVVKITADMIIKKESVRVKKTGEEVYEYKLNEEFWRKAVAKYGSISVVIDEAHQFYNPRRSMSKINIICNDWLSLIRRVLGSNDSGQGELVLITQLDRRIDVIAREMATNVSYSICHFTLFCKSCGYTERINNETPERRETCPRCNKILKKCNHFLEVYKFSNINAYDNWQSWRAKSFYKHYIIHDIEEYFKYYNTYQWEDMFSDLYN